MAQPGAMGPWPALACLAIYLALGRLIAGRIPFFAPAEPSPSGGRHESLDGLRGYLALGVFFCHATTMRSEIASGVRGVDLPASYRLMGEGSVVFFFLITGFLFWGKALRAGGRVDVVELFRGRALRIGPMYLLTVAAMVATAVAFTRGGPPDPPAHWAALGAKVLGLGAFHLGSVGGMSLERINGVLWTLTCEWRFYAGLPVLAFFLARRRRWRRLIALASAVAIVRAVRGPNRDLDLSLIFLSGMAVAELRESLGPIARLEGRSVGAACLIVLAALPACFGSGYAPGAYLLIALVFACVANGNTFFGLLTNPGARFLGTISYSIYLGHNLALFHVGAQLARWPGGRTIGVLPYWAIVFACGVAVIALASLTYRFVEHPGIELERRFRNRARRPVGGHAHHPAPVASRHPGLMVGRAVATGEDGVASA